MTTIMFKKMKFM